MAVPDKTLRHVEALVKEILAGEDVAAVLKRALEAALAAIMEGEVSEVTGADPRARLRPLRQAWTGRTDSRSRPHLRLVL